MIKTGKTDKAISFWDETGKHETMPAHLDMDILEMPGMRKASAAQEDAELRQAEHVYKEALGGLLDLHRNLLQSLPKSRSSSLGSRSASRQGKHSSFVKPRSRSLLPTLTSLDAMQHVYSDIKGLDRKSHDGLHVEMLSSFSGWETDDPMLANHLPALPHQSPSSSKKIRSTAREGMGMEAEIIGRTATPTLSTQVLDFDSCRSPTSNMNKTKIREKRGARSRRTPSPEARHLAINFRVEQALPLPRSPSAATQASASASEVVGWSPYM